MADIDPLADVFALYCEFGGSHAGLRELDNVKFAKLAKESGLVDRSKCTKTDVDLIFTSSKVRGSRRLNYDQFLVALDKIAQRKFPDLGPDAAFAQVEDMVVATGGPSVRGTKAATDSGIYSRLTQPSLYTGSHRERFTETGEGRGLDGRDKVLLEPGGGLAELTRPNLTYRSEKPKPRLRKTKNVFSSPTGASPSSGHAAPPPPPPAAAGAVSAGAPPSSPAVAPAVPGSRAAAKAPAVVSAPLSRARAGGPAGPAAPAAPVSAASAGVGDDLHTIFVAYCEFGGRKGLRELDNVKFAKLAKDAKLLDKRCTKTDVDLIFTTSKSRGSRRLLYPQFKTALQKIGLKKYPSATPDAAFTSVRDRIVMAGGPVVHGTATRTGGVYSKLTDSKAYTGSHRERFDSRGHGRGLAGRDRISTGTGHLPAPSGHSAPAGTVIKDLSQITRPNLGKGT